MIQLDDVTLVSVAGVKIEESLISTNDMPYPVEDMNYCVYNRHHFEADGIKYAPPELAAKFSTEIPSVFTRKSFGFHNFAYNADCIGII